MKEGASREPGRILMIWLKGKERGRFHLQYRIITRDKTRRDDREGAHSTSE